MTTMEQNASLGDVATRYLASLPPEQRAASQQEVNRFVRWYGWDRAIASLAVPEVGNYAERTAATGTDVTRALEPVRQFLAYARKEGLTPVNLAVHLRVKKAAPRAKSKAKVKYTAKVARKASPSQASLTSRGRDELEVELEALKKERPRVVEDIRRAAADKDFRENAPLEAAREYYGQLEGRIRELEAVLESVVVVGDRGGDTRKVEMGHTVHLRDLASGEDLCCTLVHPTEVNLAQGKMSAASPIGKALLGRAQGEVIEVLAPVGTLRYKIERIAL